jgi:hypothetical protein
VGSLPLYEHPPTNCPYNATGLQYYNIPVSGDELICSSKNYNTLNIIVAGYDWTGSNITILSGGSSNVVAFKTNNGAGWIQSQISSPYSGTSVKTEKKNLWMGAPSQPTQIYGFPYNGYTFSGNTYYYFSVASDVTQTVSDYEWNVSYGIIQNGAFSNPVEVLTNNPPPGVMGDFDLNVRVGNACGISPWLSRNGYVVGLGSTGFLNLSPNPTSYIITISEVEPPSESIPWVLRLMSQQGVMLVNVTTILPHSINVQGLQPGVYMLHARRGQHSEQHIVVVE